MGAWPETKTRNTSAVTAGEIAIGETAFYAAALRTGQASGFMGENPCAPLRRIAMHKLRLLHSAS